MDDDARLIRRFVETQDSGAFGVLVERHVGLVYRTALRLVGGDAHWAEDVAQAVFVLLARKAGELGGRGSVAGWLYEATRRVARDVRRSEERRKRREEGVVIMSELFSNGVETGAATDESAADWEKVRPVLDEAFGELSTVDREVVLLRFFGGKAFGEIGAVLRISEDGARMRVGRALEKLRGLLERRGVRSTAAALGMLIGSDAALGAPAGLAAMVTQAAVVNAAGIAVAGVGVMAFMNTIKMTGVAALVALTACVAVYEVRVKREAEAQLESARGEYAVLLAKTEEAEGQARLMKERVAVKPAASTVVPVARSSFGPSPESVEAGDALMAAHPEVRAALIASKRAQIAAQFFLLYRDLGLTVEQRREFEEIMLKGAGAQVRSSAGGGGTGITLWIRPELTGEQKEQQLRALLGEAGYGAIKSSDLGHEWNVRALRVASALYDSETPLTREQGRALRELFERQTAGFASKRVEDWDALLKEAGKFLADSQLGSLRVMQNHDLFTLTANEAAKRADARP